MANDIGFDNRKFSRIIRKVDYLQLGHKEVSAAASKALIPAAKQARQDIANFSGNTSGVSISRLLSRMVRRKRNRVGYTPGARVVIDGPDIPMGDRDWSAQGVAKLFQKDSTGDRSTRSGGANRGVFKGSKVGGGENYLSRAAAKVESETKRLFSRSLKAEMRKAINKAING